MRGLEALVWNRFARVIVRWRWWVIGTWILVAVIGGTFGGSIFDRTANVDTLTPDAESVVAKQWADQLKPGGPVVVAVALDVPSDDPALRASVLEIDDSLRKTRGVIDAIDQYQHPSG